MIEAVRQMAIAGYPVESIIHVGANEGQERHDYAASGASPCIYVEPVDDVFDTLRRNLEEYPFHRPVHAVCSNEEGEHITFNVASNDGQSSSLLALGSHAKFHPNITYTTAQTMVTTTVDRIVAEHSPQRVPNLLVIDAQGADLLILRGAARSLPSIDGVYIEVSEDPLYENGATLAEITAFLLPFGFRQRWVQLDWAGHGEAFFCRPKFEHPTLPDYQGALSVGKPAEQSSYCEYSDNFLESRGPTGGLNGPVLGLFGFHTDIEDAPWWQVDLEAEHALNEVRIYNRMDCARDRSRTLRVLLSGDGHAWHCAHDQAGYTFGGSDGRPLRVLLKGERARYVRLQLAERNYLHLDKVYVF